MVFFRSAIFSPPCLTKHIPFVNFITNHDLHPFTSKDTAQCNENCNHASRDSDNLSPTRKKRSNQTQPYARPAYCNKIPLIEISFNQNRMKSHTHKHQDNNNQVNLLHDRNFRILILDPRSIRITKANPYRKPHRNRDQHQKKIQRRHVGNLDFLTASGSKGNISPTLATAIFRNGQRDNASSGVNQAIATPDRCKAKSAGLIR